MHMFDIFYLHTRKKIYTKKNIQKKLESNFILEPLQIEQSK